MGQSPLGGTGFGLLLPVDEIRIQVFELFPFFELKCDGIDPFLVISDNFLNGLGGFDKIRVAFDCGLGLFENLLRCVFVIEVFGHGHSQIHQLGASGVGGGGNLENSGGERRVPGDFKCLFSQLQVIGKFRVNRFRFL